MAINWEGIKTTRGRKYFPERIKALNDSLEYLPLKQRASILGDVIEESGGNPLAKNAGNTYQGLLQWGDDRYRITSNNPDTEFSNQIGKLRETLNDTIDHVSWTHGGKGSGYSSFREASVTGTCPLSSQGATG